MVPRETLFRTEERRQALRKARKITAMLQGTMGLEGQGLDRKTLREMIKRTAPSFLLKPGFLECRRIFG